MEQFIEFVVNHPILWSAFAIVSAIIVFDFARSGGSDLLSPQQAVLLINRENAVPVDVRGEAEFDRGHIIGATNLPMTSLDARLQELQKLRTRPLVVYCASGMNSPKATAAIRKSGVEKVYTLKGGITAWRQENLPLSN